MHLLIPFAAPASDAGRAAAAALRLPRLSALLALCGAPERDDGDELSLDAPHERVLAKALGWSAAPGCLPWAARAAQSDGIASGTQAWGLVTPAHWHLGTEQVSLGDPDQLALDEAASRAFFAVVEEVFAHEGMTLHYGAPLRWYLAHDSLADLPCASLHRVIGRNVDRWLGDRPAARLLRRLQSEVQMLLYVHPLNDARQAQRLLPVNSFWLSGCGLAQPCSASAPQVDTRLRGPALAEDWPAWFKAWESLDEGPLAQALAAARAGQAVSLCLCGERGSLSFGASRPSLMQSLRSRWAPPAFAPLLESL